MPLAQISSGWSHLAGGRQSSPGIGRDSLQLLPGVELPTPGPAHDVPQDLAVDVARAQVRSTAECVLTHDMGGRVVTRAAPTLHSYSTTSACPILLDMPLAGVIAHLEAELRRNDAEGNALRQALAALRSQGGSLPASRTTGVRGAGRTPSMILGIMAASDDRIWTAPAMTQALTEHGWTTPQADATNAVRTAMARLAQRGDLVRLASGEYSLPEPAATPAHSGGDVPLNGSEEPREGAMA